MKRLWFFLLIFMLSLCGCAFAIKTDSEIATWFLLGFGLLGIIYLKLSKEI